MSAPLDSTAETRVPSELPALPGLTFEHTADRATVLSGVTTGSVARPHGASVWSVLPERPGDDTAIAPLPDRVEYTLLKQLGRGGMGEVWEARQESLARQVAIKRIRGDRYGEESPRTLESEFRHEAIISARLEHPNILPVHDLGTDAEGRPMIAMKRVHGRGWDAIIAEDWRTLSVSDFLGKHLPILKSVAQAVAFAHASGIIHRDLKPAQVMVGDFGEVVLMDWGLALYMTDRDKMPEEDRAMHLPSLDTASSPAGTPACMAPEQTEWSPRRLGPWTDVYLLGASLYSLLCGVFPHTSTSSRASFLLATTGDVEAPTERAKGRPVPTELESLCLSCLNREPERRPASAEAVVKSLEDYLTGATRRRQSEELVARARKSLDSGAADYDALSSCLADTNRAAELWSDHPSLATLRQRIHGTIAGRALAEGDLSFARLEATRMDRGDAQASLLGRIDAEANRRRRVERQRRLGLVASFSFLVTMLVGGLFFTLQLIQARDEAEEERDRASNALSRGDSLNDYIVVDIRQKLMNLGRLDLMESILDRVIVYLDSRVLDSQTQKEVINLFDRYDVVCKGYGSLASRQGLEHAIAQMEPLAETIFAFDPYIGFEARFILARNKGFVSDLVGNPAQLWGAFQSVRDQLESWEIEHPGDDRIALLLSFLDLNMGNELLKEGRYKDSEAHFRRALESFETSSQSLHRMTMSQDDTVSQYYSNLLNRICDSLLHQSRSEEALEVAKRSFSVGMKAMIEGDLQPKDKVALENGLEPRWVTVSRSYIAGSLNAMRLPDQALPFYEDVLKNSEKRSKAHPTDMGLLEELATARTSVATCLMDVGQWRRGHDAQREANQTIRELAAYRPDNYIWKHELAKSFRKLSETANKVGETSESLSAIQQSRDLIDDVLAQGQITASQREEKRIISMIEADLAYQHGSLDEALRLAKEYVSAAELYLQSVPDELSAKRGYSFALNRVTRVLYRRRDFEEARRFAEMNLQFVRELGVEFPDHNEVRRDVAVAMSYLRPIYEALEMNKESLELSQEMLDLLQRNLEEAPNNVENQRDVASLSMRHAQLLQVDGQNERSLSFYNRAVELRKALSQRLSNEPSYIGEEIETQLVRARLLIDMDQKEEAAEVATTSLARLQALRKDSPENVVNRLTTPRLWAMALWIQAECGITESVRDGIPILWDIADGIFAGAPTSNNPITAVLMIYGYGLNAMTFLEDRTFAEPFMRAALARLDEIDAVPEQKTLDRSGSYLSVLVNSSIICAGLGKMDEAASLVERALVHRPGRKSQLLSHELLQPLRDNPSPAFADFLATWSDPRGDATSDDAVTSESSNSTASGLDEG